MPDYTPEQLATRFENASNKLGAITDVLDALNDYNQHGEAISGSAGTALYYLNHLCDLLDRKAKELRAGHTRTPRNTLRGTIVWSRCICGFETDSYSALDDHIAYMLNTVGESATQHGER